MDDLKQLAAQHPIWSLEEFAQVTNQWLPRFLPEEKTNSRVREEVNPRLVRQYTTLGMVDAPFKEGREARYTYRHLLQLLVTRRLLTEGYGSGVIAKLLAGKDEAALETLLEGQAQIMMAPENPALAFLQGLSDRVMPKKMAPPPPAPSRKRAAETDDALFHEVRQEALKQQKAQAAPSPAYESLEEAPYFDLSSAEVEEACEGLPLLSPAPTSWTRHALAPGLELHVRDDFSIPASPHDQQAIADAILDALQAEDDRRSP